MPFNGEGAHYASLKWNHLKILDFSPIILKASKKWMMDLMPLPGNGRSRDLKGTLESLQPTVAHFAEPATGFVSTPVGSLKTLLLYDEGVFNIKDLMRAGCFWMNN
ncbi:MAG: hypothetical protein R2879_13890 [Saprospiraceae bacterium]